MPQTPTTSSPGYCDVTTYLQFHDYRQAAQLLKTDDTAYLTEAAVQASTRMAFLLLAASGQLEAAVSRGGRYTKDDLEALVDGGGAGAAFVQELVADLGHYKLHAFRHPGINPDDVPGAAGAYELLDRLASGEEILPFVETEDAGLPDSVVMAPANSQEEQDRVSVQAGRLFGTRLRTR